MYDPAAINTTVNLVDLVGQAVPLRHVSGDEYAGPCPKCGGRDRFHVKADTWQCRQCAPWGDGKAHDAIGFVMWRDNLAFLAACEALGGGKAALQGPGLGPSPMTRPPAARLPEAAAPSDLWQARARAFVAWAELQLWSDPQALAYLRGRGLRDDIIKAAHLGYCPKAYRDKAANWGLDPAEYPKGVWLPVGWTIPCEAGGVLQYVKVRQPQGEPKYLALAGSKKAGAIYGLDLVGGAFDLVICEGELSALSLRQELAGVAAVVSCGDAGNKPTAGALATMATVPRWYLAFDHDSAGGKGAAWWGELSARFRPLPWAWGDRGEKYDLNDALIAGEDLAAWAIPHLGPSPDDTAKRRAWARYWLDKLFDVPTDESGPVARAFAAILGEYMALGPDYEPGDVWQPAGGPQAGGDLRQGGGDLGDLVGDPQGYDLAGGDSWPGEGGEWQEIAAPWWAEQDLAGGRKWYKWGGADCKPGIGPCPGRPLAPTSGGRRFA